MTDQMSTSDASDSAVSPARVRAHWEIVAEGWHYTREHFVSDPTQFVGHIPAPEYDAAMDGLLLDILAVVMLHAKSHETVEIEVFHEKGDPACDDRDVRYGDCVGHMRHIHVCDQCGQRGDEYGELAWFEWPCATAKAMGLA